MFEERKQYRVHPQRAAGLSVEVVKSKEPPVPGWIADICAGGVRVFFETRFAPLFRPGESIYLRFSAEGLESPLVTPALVQHRGELEEGREYSFVFADPLGLLCCLPRGLEELFNQRGECRVEPDPEAREVEVVLSSLARSGDVVSVRGILKDLSMTGLSLSADPAAERVLSPLREVLVEVALVPDSTPVRLVARIVHRTLWGDRLHYGLVFDDERTPHFRDTLRQLSSYVAERCRRACASLSGGSLTCPVLRGR